MSEEPVRVMVRDDSPSGVSSLYQTRARRASVVGGTVEGYDFLLYSSAAGLVFPHVFFTALPPALGATLSFVTLLTGYIARPIGGLIFGHIGDRNGRRNVLMATLILMGGASFAIGLIPGTSVIGVGAPIILVCLRIVQGLAMGGEYGGAALLSMEHSSAGRRGFGAGITASGAPMGSVLATLVLSLFALMPRDAFVNWGWRVPFLVSILFVALGIYLRRKVTETPDFLAVVEKAAAKNSPLPLRRVVTEVPGRVLLAILVTTAPLFLQGLLAAFMVPFVVKQGAVSQATALMLLSLSSFVQIFAIPFYAWLSDVVGRQKVLVIAALLSGVVIWPMMRMFDSHSVVIVGLAFVLGNAVIQSSVFGPMSAFIAEMFDTETRYTGISLGYQLGAVLGAGTAPLVAQALVSGARGGTTTLTLYMTGLYLVAFCCVLIAYRTVYRGRAAQS